MQQASDSDSSVPSDQAETLQTTAAVEPHERKRAQRVPGGRTHGKDKKGTPPSNTVPYNSNNDNNDYFKLLRFGVDSLYLSYQGDLYPEMHDHLTKLKKLAQHPEADQQALAQLAIAGHIFEVKDKGSSIFPFVLEDGAFRIQLASSSKMLPMAYVKLSSRYLASITPKEAEKHLGEVLDQLGMLTGSAHVSRLDLCADFVSYENMESWGRKAWVTRAKNVAAYAVSDQFTGWTIGLGGVMACRLYNKLLEVAESDRTDLIPLWQAAGWNPGEPVWRVEFQFRGEVLAQHGLDDLNSVLANLTGLWSYASTEWLRLTIPNPDDQTRSRWPLHLLWGYLSSIDWETNGWELTRSFKASRLPDEKRIFSLAVGLIASYMAKHGITDYEDGLNRFMSDLDRHLQYFGHFMGLSGEDFLLEKVRLRAREFNTILNRTEEEWEIPEVDQAAAAYRKASDGG